MHINLLSLYSFIPYTFMLSILYMYDGCCYAHCFYVNPERTKLFSSLWLVLHIRTILILVLVGNFDFEFNPSFIDIRKILCSKFKNGNQKKSLM